MKRSITRVATGTAVILLVPLVVMQFSEDVNWNLFDFIVAGLLLFGAGMVYEMLANRSQSRSRRLIVGAIVLAVLIVIWAELAVGLFGSPIAGS